MAKNTKKKVVVPRHLPQIPFHLPYIPLQLIFEGVAPLDVIKFAFVSEKTRNLIENNVKLQAKRLCLRERPSTLQARIIANDDQEVHFVLQEQSDKEREENFTKSTFTEVWGIMLKLPEKPDSDSFFTVIFQREADKRKFFVNLVGFIRKVFIFENTELESKTDGMAQNVLSIFKNSPIPKLGHMEIEWHTPKSVNLAELEKILSSADTLQLGVYLPKSKYRGPLNPRKLSVTTANWLTVDSLKQMKCEEIEADGTMFSAEDINNFLKHWKLIGYSQDLKICQFSQNGRFLIDPDNEEEMATVLEGLDTIKGIPPLLDTDPFKGFFDSSRTWFFKQESGMLITLEIWSVVKTIKIVSWNDHRLGNPEFVKFSF